MKWKDGQEVDYKPRKEVVQSNLFEVGYVLISVRILISLYEIEEKVNSEEILHYLIGYLKCVRALEIIGKSEHVNEARIADHEKDDYVENRFQFALMTNNQVTLNEGLLNLFLNFGLIRINFIYLNIILGLFNLRLICLNSLLNLVI